MRKNRFKFKFIVCIIALVCFFFSGNKVRAYTNHTQQEAIYWATNKGNTSWNIDYDGSYGCQCVDLILAYYDYLVGYHVSGNACEYANDVRYGSYYNRIPEGWTRVDKTKGARPRRYCCMGKEFSSWLACFKFCWRYSELDMLELYGQSMTMDQLVR